MKLRKCLPCLLLCCLLLAIQLRGSELCDSTYIRALCREANSAIAKDLNASYHLALQAADRAKFCKGSFAYYEAVILLGKMYNKKDYPDSTCLLMPAVLEQFNAATPKKYIASANMILSTAYIIKTELDKGLRHALTALKNYELNRDTSGIANVLVNIADIYRQQSNYRLAARYLGEAHKMAPSSSDKSLPGYIYNQQGIIYAQQQQLDSAEKFFLLSMKAREMNGSRQDLAWSCNNLGGLYEMQGRHDEALAYFEKAYQSFSGIANYLGMSGVIGNLGLLYMNKKEFKKALHYYMQSRMLYAKTGDKDNLENLYTNLSNYYSEVGDLKLAYIYSDSLNVLKDTLFGQRLDEKMAEMQTRYETEKKDLEISKKNGELKIKEEQALIKNLILAGIICLLIVSSIAAYFFYRKKQVQQQAELAAELARQKEIRNRSVIEAEEKERIRIATDLHDGVGQLLSAAKLNLSSLEHKVKIESPEQQLAFSNALALVDDSVREVRAVSHNMMPNTLLKLGLASAVKEFVTKIQGTPNLKVNLEIVGMDHRLEQEKETVLYRVIQELVANIIKHAKASELTLQMIRHEKDLSIVIEDNGVGFDTSGINDFEGIGLKNIQSRMEFISGEVHFDSTPGHGTTVVIHVST